MTPSRKTGKTPRELLTEAQSKGFKPGTKAPVVAEWLRDDYGVGPGHAMAFFHVLRRGNQEHLTATAELLAEILERGPLPSTGA